MKKINDLWNDEPIKPLDKVMFWMEYVIRHNGTAHLRSPYADVPWYQFLLIDVIAATLFVVLTPIVILYKIVSSLVVKKKTVSFKTQSKSHKKKQ